MLWLFQIPQRYRFSSKSQQTLSLLLSWVVVLDTTKVQIFKQITTDCECYIGVDLLFQIPQRYRFSSKSQLFNICIAKVAGCFRYHKGTDFQANHNLFGEGDDDDNVVLDTTKVQIFKQITTGLGYSLDPLKLFQIPQRYRFSSKSQQVLAFRFVLIVVLDTTKVQIFKQITTILDILCNRSRLFQIPQRYRFSSKSQPSLTYCNKKDIVLDTTKVQIFKQITTL